MTNSKIIKCALMGAAGAALYISLVATFMFNAEKILGHREDTIFAPMAFLTLFVFSAALMGMIIFARPILWYLDGLKKEAVKLIFYTLGFLFLALILFVLLLILF